VRRGKVNGKEKENRKNYRRNMSRKRRFCSETTLTGEIPVSHN
jgi:hypothetical protein